jgi:hypothetical protein
MRTPCLTLSLACLVAWSQATHADAGQSDELSRADALVARYCGAWSKTDPAERQREVAGVWAEDGEYLDSQPARASGREGLEAEIKKFQQQFPGARFHCEAVKAHHGFVGYTWTMVSAEGSPLMQGMDFGEIDSSGRLVRIVSFFDMPPSAP